ncbi:uncharacterized protein LOC144420839 [Styela clava]
MEDKDDSILLALRQERARALASQSKYYEAASLIDDTGIPDEETSISTKLMMAHCYLYLGRENKAMKYVKDVRKALLSAPNPDVEDIMGLIYDFIQSKSYACALILLPIASDMYKKLDSPDDVIDKLFRCIHAASECTTPMIEKEGRSRIIAIDFGIEYMAELLDDLRETSGCDPEKQVTKEALATILLAFDYWKINDNHKGVKLRERAIASLKKQFGKNASKQRVLGKLYYNTGVGYDILNKKDLAKQAYENAVQAYEDAKDYDTEMERNNDIQECKKKLKQVDL